jgi:multicomponent Na+:H+ antiporter subunit B
MKSPILNTATRMLVALMLLFSIYTLLRGHDEPGGGFIGGLIAAIGFSLYAIAHGGTSLRSVLRLDPRVIAIIGLATALLAGLFSGLSGDAPFTGQWWFFGGGAAEKGLPISTVLLFDIGVYIAVVGALLTLVLALEREV